MIISCQQARKDLVHLLSGNVGKDQARILLEHLRDCPGCAQERDQLEQVLRGLDLLDGDVEVPAYLRKKTLALIFSEAQSAVPGLSSVKELFGKLSVRKALAAIGLGTIVALAFGFILTGKVEAARFSFPLLLALGAFWGAVFVCAFGCIFGNYRLGTLQLQSMSTIAVLTTVLVMLGTYVCPDRTIFQWWDGSVMGSTTAKFLGHWGSNFLFGVLYTLPAALLVSGMWGSRLKGNIPVNGLMTSSLIILMLFPAIYLQCASLAIGLAIIWSLGTLLGAFGGVCGGLGIRQLVINGGR